MFKSAVPLQNGGLWGKWLLGRRDFFFLCNNASGHWNKEAARLTGGTVSSSLNTSMLWMYCGNLIPDSKVAPSHLNENCSPGIKTFSKVSAWTSLNVSCLPSKIDVTSSLNFGCSLKLQSLASQYGILYPIFS